MTLGMISWIREEDFQRVKAKRTVLRRTGC